MFLFSLLGLIIFVILIGALAVCLGLLLCVYIIEHCTRVIPDDWEDIKEYELEKYRNRGSE